MNCGLFHSFSEMLESIPIKAVVRAADAERKMVEDDLEKRRTEPDEDVISVLNFCGFLAGAVGGIRASIPLFPIAHCAFYRKIVQRLVEADELPRDIAPEFDRIFYRALSKALTTDDAGPGFDDKPVYN